MTRILAFIAFVLAALLAFVSDFTAANIALVFIVGVVAVGLALYTVPGSWGGGPQP